MKYPVLIPNIFNFPFTYESDLDLKVGDYVYVPFGKSKITGVVWNEFEKKNNKNFQIKKILKKIEIEPLKKEIITFLNWFSEYNLVPKGMCLKLHLLSGEAITNYEDENYLSYNKQKFVNKFTLSSDQREIFEEMSKENNKFRVHLLQGTTGSGKTIVYFKHIKQLLEIGYQAMILLPEIGLTAEFENKFEEFFGFSAAVWHSGITPKKKKIIWSGVSSGKINVIIGARSSLFLPFKNLGIIVVDEEHDQSFKQDEGVIYNARDMAIARANFENIPINLVTAVPSIETYANIKKKKYSVSRLTKRYKDANLPSYEIIDLNKNKLDKQSWIANETLEKVNNHLKKNDQVLFFINRRGFAPYALCKKCLNVYSCPNCSINLVFHKHKNTLLCHYCGFKNRLNRSCIKGGNCDLTKPGDKIVTKNNVTIVGYTDFPSRMASQSSTLYATNIRHMIDDLTPKKDGKININMKDDVIRGSTVTHNGEITFPPPPPKVQAIAKQAPKPFEKTPEDIKAEEVEAFRKNTIQQTILLCIGGLFMFVIGNYAPSEFMQHMIVFALACFVGFQVIWNVSHALHTPLMAVTNAISGIIIIGAVLQMTSESWIAIILAAISVLISTINIVGGFLVTRRMLAMFQKS